MIYDSGIPWSLDNVCNVLMSWVLHFESTQLPPDLTAGRAKLLYKRTIKADFLWAHFVSLSNTDLGSLKHAVNIISSSVIILGLIALSSKTTLLLLFSINIALYFFTFFFFGLSWSLEQNKPNPEKSL